MDLSRESIADARARRAAGGGSDRSVFEFANGIPGSEVRLVRLAGRCRRLR